MKIKTRNYPEFDLQCQFVKWLEIQHPDVMFLSDTIANVKLNGQQAGRNKKIQKKDFKCMDVIILEPNKYYHGLLIELKVETPYKLNGELKKDEHLEAQNKSIEIMREKGYYACFCWSLEMAIITTTNYLKNR